jgi:iron complex outermembrane receptor protein
MRGKLAALTLYPLLCTGIAAGQTVDAPAAPRPEEVIVTGTRLQPRAAEQSAQEVRVYDRKRIQRSGTTTVAEFLATVPEVSLNSNESTFGATSARLRGAREGSTLILINGRRTQAVTADSALIGFFDLNTIPLSMIERIDVLPSGSSAVYGGEALAGVINIVLRSDFEGAEASIGYKSADDTDEQNYYGGIGWSGESASVSLMASYSDRSPLSGSDREITNSGDLRRWGGPNLNTPFLGAPATISSTGGNLPGLNSNVAAVPRGSSGLGLQPSDFAATAGTQNLGSFSHYQDLLLHSVRKGAFLSARYRFDNDVELFAEVLASQFDSSGFTTPSIFQQTTVPATNAFNPFGVAVRVSGVVGGTPELSTFAFRDELFRPLIGARGKLGTWGWELTALSSRDRGGQDIYAQPNAALVSAALASSDPATALNPFADGPVGSPELLAQLYGENAATDWEGEATLLNGFARGPLLQLPAGALDAVIGAEYEQSGLQRGMDANRYAHAVFTELRLPLMARRGGGEMLALSGAARWDDYSDFGSETTWQGGIEFRPIDSLLLRATYGTSFKPPTLFALASPRSSSALPVTDPLRNREPAVIQSISGGNPDLDPTTGESSTLGIAWSPRGVQDLNLSLTAWTLRIDNAINLPGAQFIIDNESSYPGRVVRAPAAAGQVGTLVSADRSYLNFGSIRQEGLDSAIDWSLQTRAGVFSPALAATYMTKFEGASAPGGADVNRLSHAISDGIFAPRLKGTASLGWSPRDALKLSLAGRYVGRYHDYTPTHMLGDNWYLDVAVEVGVLSNLRMFVTCTNCADELPPYSTHFRGYDIYNYDLIGRTIFVRLQIQT